MIRKILFAIAFAAAVIIAFIFVYNQRDGEGVASPDVVAFAKCIASKGAVMYGAYWCPHCQNEKKAFGDAFQYIPYVECTEESEKCIADGITGYPTWIFGSPAQASDPSATSSKRLEGEQGFERLSINSGCPLPNSNADTAEN